MRYPGSGVRSTCLRLAALWVCCGVLACAGGAVTPLSDDTATKTIGIAVQSPSPVSRADLEAMFKQGNEVFQAGLNIAKGSPAVSNAKFAEAAALWREVAAKGGIHNAMLETNIANASVLAGDVPRAIAAYRRALAIDPQNRGVRNGLAAARKAAGTEALAPGSMPTAGNGSDGGLRGTLTRIGQFASWAAERTLEFLPMRLLLVGAGGLYLLGFGLAAARLHGARGVPRWAPGATLVLSVLAAGPIVAREMATSGVREAVIVQAGVLGRNGPAEMYDPAFKEPLTPGLEVRITERRGEWSAVRISDGRTAWVPATSLEGL